MRLVFFGSPAFAVPSLKAVASQHEVLRVLCQPDRPAGRGRALQPPAVKEAALALGLPIDQPTKLRDGTVTASLQALNPDLFVVVAYGRILPPDLLAVPRLGPWNVHGSLLPKYRGAAPIQWSIMRGESQSGVCIMQMEEGLDTGPVAACQAVPIADDDTAGSLSDRLSIVGADLLLATLGEIAAGTAKCAPQDGSQATLAPPLSKDDGRLDFRAEARLVSAQARGVDPWPGATAVVDGEVVRLFQPRLHAGQGTPGEVLGLVPEGLVIACGTGAIAFAELQFPGRKRLPAAAVLSGRAVPVGSRLEGKV